MFRTHREKITYLFFGVLTTAVSILSFAAFSWLFAPIMAAGWALNAANLLSVLLAVTFAYATNRRYVFLSKSRGRAAAKEAASFFAGRFITMLADLLLMNILVSVLGVWDLAAKCAVTVLVIVLNYIIAKRWVFQKGEAEA